MSKGLHTKWVFKLDAETKDRQACASAGMLRDALCACLKAHIVQACSRLGSERLMADMKLQRLVVWAPDDLQAS